MQMNPCPFCGEAFRLGVVTKWLRIDHGYSKRGAYARCKRCNARGSLVADDIIYDVRNETASKCAKALLIDRAVAAWNAAGHPHETPEALEELPLFGQWPRETRFSGEKAASESATKSTGKGESGT